jgi:sarcosine oxidase
VRSTGGGAQSKPPPDSFSRRSLLVGAGGVALSPAILKAAPTGSKARIAVIGAGVFGAWTAEHLRRAGHAVTLIEAQAPAHSRASSGGESRMTRGAYGKDALYTRMALDSLAEWKALEAPGGLPIFHRHGVLFFFPKEDPYFRDSLAAHKTIGLPTEALTAAQMAKRFPMIDFGGIELGLFEPGFGGLMARRGVQTLAMRFMQGGGLYQQAAVAPPSASGGKLSALRTVSGATIEADVFVFACGPWLGKLFPDLLGPRIFATRQEIFLFAPPAGEAMFQPGQMPGWADFNGGDMYYGFPDLEGRGVKFAHDAHGVRVDPDTQSRKPTDAALAKVIAFRDRRFPLLRGAPLTGAEVCQYENSSNGDFLIDFHPEMANVLLVGGGSGHGFKHGPEVGRYAAARLLGNAVVEPRFSLSSKNMSQHREVH